MKYGDIDVFLGNWMPSMQEDRKGYVAEGSVVVIRPNLTAAKYTLNLFGLGSFKLIESSEQGMLAEVERAMHDHAPIVFLAWDPHPMNMRFDLRYLAGGDAVFGPDSGGAAVYTNTRACYSRQCPNRAYAP
jgi:glycine betaine/proline transport system substrate-binding protein